MSARSPQDDEGVFPATTNPALFFGHENPVKAIGRDLVPERCRPGPGLCRFDHCGVEMGRKQARGGFRDHVAFVSHRRIPHLTPTLSSPEEREKIQPSPPGRRGWRAIASRVRWFRAVHILIAAPAPGQSRRA